MLPFVAQDQERDRVLAFYAVTLAERESIDEGLAEMPAP